MKKKDHQKRTLSWLPGAFILVGLLVAGASTTATLAADPAPVQQDATSTPGQLQLPTATATLLGGPSATPTRTQTPVPVVAEVIGDPTTNLRSLPTIGDEYIIEALSPGIRLPILGRWLGYDWLLVAWEDGPDGQAWVYEPLVIIQGDITTIPAVEPPPAPTANPTEEAIAETATVLLLTPGAVEAATATAAFAAIQATQDAPLVADESYLPTFTPAAPYVQLETLPTPDVVESNNGPIPPAVLIISLGAMGLLLLVIGLVRRLL